jgi:hypothetical protein
LALQGERFMGKLAFISAFVALGAAAIPGTAQATLQHSRTLHG